MDADEDEDEYGAYHWVMALMDNGDGPLDPDTSTQCDPEFVWWVLEPANYPEFRAVMDRAQQNDPPSEAENKTRVSDEEVRGALRWLVDC